MWSIRSLLWVCLFFFLFSFALADTSGTVVSQNTTNQQATWIQISKIDVAKVREVWLSLHNAERKIKWLTPFVYSSALEWAASTWANYLASRNGTTHKRKSTDGYYSYASIKSWFANLGIVFADKETSGQPLFTENLWRNMYSCKKTDCTDDFIKAIKKSRTFFMSEKYKKSKPHYNAIVGNFENIGLGVAISGWLIIHKRWNNCF